MSDKPYMPLWVADFLAKTMGLDAREIGAYMLLIMALWSHGGTLPNNPKKLQRIARCGRDWPRVWEAISHFFTVDDDTISQQRVTEELQKMRTKREVNAQNGARGGRAKALKQKQGDLANATISPEQPYPYPEYNTHTSYECSDPQSKGDDDAERKSPVDDAPNNTPGTAKPKAGTGKRAIGERAEPTEKDIQHAEQRGIDWRAEWPKFRDYHIRAETRTTYRGWRAAWRTWCRKSVEFKSAHGPARQAAGGRGRITWEDAAALAMAKRSEEPPPVEDDSLPEWFGRGDGPDDSRPTFRLISGGSGGS